MTILSLGFVAGCDNKATAGIDAHIDDLMKTVSNDDVTWERGYAALTYALSRNALSVIGELTTLPKPEVYKVLYKYLDDKNRFVVAHIFLGRFTRTPDKVLVMPYGIKYGDLLVNFSSDGTASVSPSQIPMLKKKWEGYVLREQPKGKP